MAIVVQRFPQQRSSEWLAVAESKPGMMGGPSTYSWNGERVLSLTLDAYEGKFARQAAFDVLLTEDDVGRILRLWRKAYGKLAA